MSGVIRNLTRKSRYHDLPRLKGRFKNPLDVDNLDSDIELVMLAGIVRDEWEAEKLLTASDLSAARFLAQLPKRRINYWKRIKALFRSIEGAYESDPHRDEYQEARREYGYSDRRKTG